MSYDLAFWAETPSPSDGDAVTTYERLADEEVGVCEVSSATQAFLAELLGAYPDLSEENMWTSPWAAAIYSNDECVIVTISPSRAEEVVPVLVEMATIHGIIAFDPQLDHVLNPRPR